MNFINNIEIKNFKSIRHQKIEGCKRINVFIGYPNVGKSNILEALSLASPDFSNSGKPISLKDLCRFDELIGLYNDGNKQKEVQLTIDGFSYLLEYFDQNTIQYHVVESNKIIEDVLPDLLESNKRLIINQLGNFSQVSLRSDKIQPAIKLKKYQFRGIQSHIRNNPVNLDFPFGGNLYEVLRYNGDLRKQCGELFSDYDLKLAFDEAANLKIQKQLDEFSVFQIPMIQVSDTLLRLIFHKAAINSNVNSILLFEEPEAHMFPPYIAKFTADVMFDKNHNQYFIATHSPFILNDFMEDLNKEDYAIFAVGYNKEAGETVIRKITDEEIDEVYQYGIDLFFNLENYLKDAV